MKNFILIITFLSSSLSFGQVWIDDNAVWNYEIEKEANPGSFQYVYEKDTLIGGELCQKIRTTRQIYFLDEEEWIPLSPVHVNYYTYVSGDTVFYYFNNQFFVLYDFGAEIGDQWLVADIPHTGYALCNDSSFVEVVDTGSMTIGGDTYRTITLETLEDSPYVLEGVFVERFGFIPDSTKLRMFPYPVSCNPSFIIEPYYVTFRCFQDDSFPLYNPSGEDCVYIPTYSNVSVTEADLNSPSVFPNPSTGNMTITLDGTFNLNIFSIEGRLIYAEKDLQSGEFFFADHLKNGTYFLVIQQENGRSWRQKIIVQQ